MFSLRSFYIGLALFSVIIFTFQHDLIGQTIHWATPRIEQVKGQIRDTVAQQERMNRAITGFSRVAAHKLSDAKLNEVIVWKKVTQSIPHPTDNGEVLLSLVPVGECEAPYIWNVTRDTLIQVETPVTNQPSPADDHWCATQLGAFHGGLAPAGIVKYSATTAQSPQNTQAAVKQPETLWGYVDTQGKWVIPPHYKEAGSFVGDIAIVRAASNEAMVINRAGQTLAWPPAYDNRFTPIYLIAKLKRFDKWVWINHQTAGLAPTYLTDGVQMIPVPGRTIDVSQDGELWLLQTEKGPRLWKPVSGFVSLPDNLTPVKPISGTSFTSNSNSGQTLALFSLDGTKIADSTPFQQPLTPTRFIACISGVPDSLYDPSQGTLPKDRQCGVMDEKGQWWANPVYQVIEQWGEHEVRMQTGKIACMADLRETSAPVCTNDTAASRRVPFLDFDNTQQPYAYQTPDNASPPIRRYMLAYPYMGHVAKVVEQNGLHGLIDEQQQWLTPHLSVPLLTEAHILSVESIKVGTGLIDRSGKWVIPPVFVSIGRYSDGTLNACMLRSSSYCMHLDTSGNSLPPTAEQTLDSRGWEEPHSIAQVEEKPEQVKSVATTPHYRAVALNGVWGFQDESGKWLIKPQFDDAEDFYGERGAAAVKQDISKEEATDLALPDGAPSKQTRWGIINPSGKWVVKPQFEAIGVFKDGVAVAKEFGVFGLIDEQGNWVINAGYSYIGTVDHGYAPAVNRSGGNCLINVKDRIGCLDGIDMVYKTGDKFIVAKDHAAHYGYVTADGKWAISPTFTAAYPFVGDFATASTELPELAAEERAKWITVEVQPLHNAHIFAVAIKHRGASAGAPSRFALMDDSGHWLEPNR